MKTTPPKWMEDFIERSAPPGLREEILGDLFETFSNDVRDRGPGPARRRYVLNAIGFTLKTFYWKKRTHTNHHTVMIGTYFRLAQRTLLAHRGNTVINILGLVVGIAAALVIFSYVRYERSFDTFHSDAGNIYRLIRVTGTGLAITDQSECRTGVSYPVPDALKSELTAIREITSVQNVGGVLAEVVDADGTVAKQFLENGGYAFAEPSFFRVFDFRNTGFHWIEGNPAKALTEPYELVLTASMADKYFGDEPALGKLVSIDKRITCKVAGVVSDLPPNTDFPFTALISYPTLRLLLGDRMNNWYSVNDDHHTYLKLDEKSDPASVNKLILNVHAAHAPKDLHQSRHYLLQPLDQVHYDARFGTFTGKTISRRTIDGLMILAAFLLLAGCINYVNLSTAQAATRAKEIGLRKVMGSHRGNVAMQQYAETFLIVLVSASLALGVAQLTLDNLQSLLGIRLSGYTVIDARLLLTLAAVVLILTLLAAFYPSVVISRMHPVEALRSRFSSHGVGGVSVRKFLVVFQFAITQLLVIGTFIVMAQMEFFRSEELGFRKDAIITVRVPERDSARLGSLYQQFMSLSGVEAVAFSSTLPSGRARNRSYSGVAASEVQNPSDFKVYERQWVDTSYFRLYEIPLLAGRNLLPGDTTGNVVLNEKLIRDLGILSAEDALGKRFQMDGRTVTVVGVARNFHSNSLKEDYDNIGFAMNPKAFSYASIRLASIENLEPVLAGVERVWKSHFPGRIYDFSFFDENVRAFYDQEERYEKLFQLFSAVFLVIGCLGLYGLVTFVINRKSKEVAVRKVLGATVANVLVLFSREYVQLIVIAFLIAAPLSYVAATDWLSNFKNQIELNWWLFALPGTAVLAMAIAVVSFKSFTAANANPASKLRGD